MIKNIHRTWFEVWGDETAQNKVLKGLNALLVTLVAIQSVALVTLSLRKPVLIAVSSSESKVIKTQFPNEELIEQEVRRIVSSYSKARHNWEWNQIESRLNEAVRYVDKDFYKTFKRATNEQVKIAMEKKISQVFYASEVTVDLDAKTATITGDRILTIDGLRAANSMKVAIGFRLNSRSSNNPEGVYITSEKLITNH